jgi:glycosyltransferase involved in cell wall biosynthesis
MISAGSGFAPAAGGMAGYYEGLLAALCEHPRVGSIVAFVPPWHDGLAVPDHRRIEVVRCIGLGRPRPWRVAYEQTVLPLAACRHRVDVLLSTCNVRPMTWRGPSVVVLQSMQHLLLPVKTPRVRRAYLDFAVRRSLQTADTVIAVSETSRADAVRVFSLDPSRIVSVHHGAAPWVRETVEHGVQAPPHRLPGGEPYVFTISRLYELKNHPRLIEALARLVRERGIPHRLLIAGGDADYRRSDLESMAREHGIEDRVACLGPVPQELVPSLFAGADAVAYVSLYETFGLPVLEALAFGVPLVTSATGATSEVAGDAARLVDPADVQSIANGLADVLLDAPLRARLRVAGPARVRDFSWERSAEGTVAALEQAISLHRSPTASASGRPRRGRRGRVAGLARAKLGREALHRAGKHGLRRLFEIGQHAGVDLLPRHFYSEIPAIAELRSSSAWRAPRDTSSIRSSDMAAQLSFLRTCCTPAAVGRMPRTLYDDACAKNGAIGFGPIEAQVLYCFVASRRPRRVVQIGCGVSTAVILRACRDFEHAVKLVCVEPYPTRFLTEAAESGAIELIRSRAQDVELSQLTALESGDLLFVDSTHTVKPGGEVTRIVLDVLPRLPAGVFSHFHDVIFPYDYSPEILRSDLFFWSESVLLHAFLSDNARCSLRLALSMVHHADPESLAELLPDYSPARFEDGVMHDQAGAAHFPSSAYMQID